MTSEERHIVYIHNSIRPSIGKISEIMEACNFFQSFDGGKRVFVKPNLFCPEASNTGATVNLDLLRFVVRLLVDRGFEVTIGEVGAHQYNACFFKDIGIYELAEEEGAKFFDLNQCERVPMKLWGDHVFYLPKLVLDTDFLVNVPKLKTHAATRVSLAMKNLYGLLPDKEKWKGHALGLDETIVALNKLFPSSLVIVDGITAMEGFGPTMGLAKKTNLVIGASNALVNDIVCCKILGVNPLEVEHIRIAMKHSSKKEWRNCKIFGEIKKCDDFSIPSRSFSKIWYKIQELFYRSSFTLDRWGIDPKAIMRSLIKESTISFFRRVQIRNRLKNSSVRS
jgi:uncharacterized protein (DUF362 family)